MHAEARWRDRGVRSAIRTGAFAVAALWGAEAFAQETPHHLSHPPLLVGTSLSYFVPTAEGRRIHSVFLDAFVGTELVYLLGWNLYGGLTATVASGDITQWGEDFVDVRYDARAGGLGPMAALSVEPLRQLCPERCAGLSFSLDLSGAFVLYTADFPPGGDVYNFVWRMGGGLGYAVTPIWRLELGGRWMHVSNGQGLSPFNPSYEGAGATLTSRFRF